MRDQAKRLFQDTKDYIDSEFRAITGDIWLVAWSCILKARGGNLECDEDDCAEYSWELEEEEDRRAGLGEGTARGKVCEEKENEAGVFDRG